MFISALLSVSIYVLITYALVIGANDNERLTKILNFFGIKSRGIVLLFNIGGPAILLIILFFLFKLCINCASQIGKLSIKYPRLQDSSFDKVKEIYNKMTSDLQLSCPPVVYITKSEKSKDKNIDKDKNTVFGIKMNSSKAFSIDSKIIEDAIKKMTILTLNMSLQKT